MSVVVLEAGCLPEVALFGVDEANGGILFIGVGGAEVGTLTGEVLKLNTHYYCLSVCLDGRRHGALDEFICFPAKNETNVKTAHLVSCMS